MFYMLTLEVCSTIQAFFGGLPHNKEQSPGSRLAITELLRAAPGSLIVFALCCNSYCRMFHVLDLIGRSWRDEKIY